MRRLLALALVVGFTQPTGAAGPIEASMARAVQAINLSTPQSGHRNTALVRLGVGAVIAGGALIVFATMVQTHLLCVVDGDILVECDANKKVLGAGVALAAGGAVMTAFGVRTHLPEVTIQRRGVGIRHTVLF